MIPQFALRLICGMALGWCVSSRRDITSGFFRIQMRLLLALAVLSALLLSADVTWVEPTLTPESTLAANAVVSAPVSQSPSTARTIADAIRWISISVAVIAYAGSIFWALGRRVPGNLCIYLLTILCVSALILHSRNVPNRGTSPQQLLSDVSSAAVLGGVVTGMLLGHWYLTTPAMSIHPLWWFNKAILGAVGFRMAASLWAVAGFGATEDSTHQIWLGIRWVGGIVAPAVMTILVWRILKHRNTQSATGVLFAGLILVFMGEMTAALLERDTFIPY